MALSPSRPLLLIIAYLAFISLGLPDPLIGVAWPGVRRDFGLPLDAAALVFFGFGLSYFLSSFFTGRLLKFYGIGCLLAVSSGFVALGGFGFALAPVWLLFASCSLLHGLGSGAIDAGLNHYAASHFSARHMNWMHACYSLGATFGPAVMTAMIAWHHSWRLGYATIAGMLLLLSGLFMATRRHWTASNEVATEAAAPVAHVPLSAALRHGRVWLQVLLFFIYTGLEVTIGQWSYSILTEARGYDKGAAGFWVTLYWAGIGVGRLLLGFVIDHWGVDRVIRYSLLTAVGAALLFMANLSASASAVALPGLGLGLAVIFPALMTRTPQRFGKAIAAHTIGVQVSAGMLGAAALPSIAGVLAQRTGLESVTLAITTVAAGLLLLHELLLAMDRHRS